MDDTISLSVSQQEIKLLTAIEKYYPNLEFRKDNGELRWGQICPGAEKTVQFLKDKSYTAFITSFTDALLFIELLVVRSKMLKEKGINTEKLLNDVLNTTDDIYPELKGSKIAKSCRLAEIITGVVERQLKKLENKSFYKDIPDLTYPRRHLALICAFDKTGNTFLNLSFIFGGLALVYQGLKNMRIIS